ncbi:MAG: crotonase/enoyl-CoA hydratase family protein [Proteobacteria bacterium]|nr:crotonase/enoyl-CoA hydratase family protein [Pseudomonadota bacterium]
MAELVTVSIEDHVADVRFNRPDKYNALSFDMVDAMADTLRKLSRATTVRAVVLSGEGKGFCAGLDVETFSAMIHSDTNPLANLEERYQGEISNIFQFVAYGYKQLPMPVIAAIHGAALGGGFQIALGADIRLAAPDAKLSIMEIKWGLIPDMSASQTLRDLVPLDVAKEMVFTGKIINGKEACHLGLVTRVCENPYEDAKLLAREIASKSPHAVRMAKKLLNEFWHCDEATGLLKESQFEMALIGSPNQCEAVSANLEKRKPLFYDPV